MEHRPIHTIAREILANWRKVNYAAQPYLRSMLHLEGIDDADGHDSARSVVQYFLANAGTFRGEAARRLKAELRGMV